MEIDQMQPTNYDIFSQCIFAFILIENKHTNVDVILNFH